MKKVSVTKNWGRKTELMLSEKQLPAFWALNGIAYIKLFFFYRRVEKTYIFVQCCSFFTMKVNYLSNYLLFSETTAVIVVRVL